jgi:hypothetical protein
LQQVQPKDPDGRVEAEGLECWQNLKSSNNSFDYSTDTTRKATRQEHDGWASNLDVNLICKIFASKYCLWELGLRIQTNEYVRKSCPKLPSNRSLGRI